jgi:protease-4
VARISIEGIITEDPARDRALARIAEDDHARALIVAINSPGGTVVGGENLYRVLRRVAEKKPVVAVMGTVAASGGYMTAIGADRIYARAGTLTGSIGVILQSADVTGLLKKLGVEPEVIKSSPLKAVPNPLEPLTEEGRAATRAVVMDMYEQFVAMVAERRKLELSAARNLADGRIFTGRQAVDRRLVDAIGGETEARDWLAKTHKVTKSLPVRQIHVRDEPGELLGLVGRIVGKTLFSERLTLDGLVSIWHPDLN